MICIAGKNEVAVLSAKYAFDRVGRGGICVIPNDSDTGYDTWQPSLKKWAVDVGVRIAMLEDVYAEKDLLFISLEFAKLIVPSRFKTKRLFNIHFSKLPEYRGAHTSIWPILEGRGESAATLHRMDAGIDTGDVIAQKCFEISDEDTSYDLYMKYQKAGRALFQEYFDRLVADEVTSSPQPIKNASFKSRRDLDLANVQLDLKRTAFQVKNQIRAFSFRPYQLPVVLSHPVSGCRVTNVRSTAKPGTLLRETASGFTFATIDYDVEIVKDPFGRAVACCRNGAPQTEMADAFEALGALNDRTPEGWTLLIVAAYSYYECGVKWLVSHGASPNQSNYKGTTVLMYAKSSPYRKGDLSLIRWLVENGADVNSRDINGMTLLQYVQRDGDGAMADYLRSVGAHE